MTFSLTRIAPTPSGFLHLGNAYSFLVTKALAEKHGTKILLRIDDLDRERFRTEYVEDVFETLDFLEIKIDQGPKNLREFETEWSQIHRMEKYRETLAKLKASRKVFACDCSRKKIQQLDPSGYYLGQCLERRLSLEKPEVAWRMDTSESDFLHFMEYPDQQKSALIQQDSMFYMVRKKDGLPSYHLSSLVDDLHFGVDLIVRGNDLFPSSLAQLDLARNLDLEKFSQITFHHHSLIRGPKQEKLSKSDGATSIQFLRKEGKKLTDIFEILGKLAGTGEQVTSFEEFKSTIKI
ncbi:glutamate--tRNA ligase family protein [Algoriphagus sp. A40]|uniref:glutamate--tRNA ligase family protein n=1 Tax=Algoriphagus sp. A40 TaxID=1945863 RepID=UPI0009870671|nr:glutamate--tRNA ligase family protein [Algoriphagus sp. A40]OOG72208.1 tRNA glutamyl-Q synthetase [Algoriphagus sp. A40]